MLNIKNLLKQGSKDQPAPPTWFDKICAFHSILAMLAQIQQEDPFKTEDVTVTWLPSASKRKQLKLSNAFAHLAVTNNEVVAATLYALEGLTIMMWMQDEEPDSWDKPETAQDTPKAKFWDKMSWVFTTNTRLNDHHHTSAYRAESPWIVKAMPPPGYPTAGDPKTNLCEYLDEFPKK